MNWTDKERRNKKLSLNLILAEKAKKNKKKKLKWITNILQ